MGTRGLMGIRIDGQDKLTYCHFDSYPDGWPIEMVQDIKKMLEHPGIERMRELARAVKQVTEGDVPSEEALASYNIPRKYWQQVSTGADWYAHLRGLHGKFEATLDVGLMLNSNDFIEDSLFCEWAYVANLDDMLFEIYEGLQPKRHDRGRFAHLPAHESISATYYPCALLGTFPLTAIPDDWFEWLESMSAANSEKTA